MFFNNQIEINHLPKIENVQLIQIDKRYFKIILFNLIFTFSITIGVTTILKFIMVNEIYKATLYWYVLIGLIILFIIQLVIYKLSFNLRRYAIRDKDIIYSQGLLTNTISTLPFNRIQHIEIERSFLSRRLGLSNLKIYSAGESGSDLSINGLPHESAEKINAFLINLLNERL